MKSWGVLEKSWRLLVVEVDACERWTECFNPYMTCYKTPSFSSKAALYAETRKVGVLKVICL